ncbi:hypothetical protein B0T21DRAFT_354335 [Apiosordaria backusii]|uniref:Uncharacterized protein n=1 Tax=Apiosordaria backusii TaxID=314023 RepID=A0AA40K670_9PEZI|nr:hypothetical protein B0T21DRAFT_354335 [Apiosordaria backusii]
MTAAFPNPEACLPRPDPRQATPGDCDRKRHGKTVKLPRYPVQAGRGFFENLDGGVFRAEAEGTQSVPACSWFGASRLRRRMAGSRASPLTLAQTDRGDRFIRKRPVALLEKLAAGVQLRARGIGSAVPRGRGPSITVCGGKSPKAGLWSAEWRMGKGEFTLGMAKPRGPWLGFQSMVMCSFSFQGGSRQRCSSREQAPSSLVIIGYHDVARSIPEGKEIFFGAILREFDGDDDSRQ